MKKKINKKALGVKTTSALLCTLLTVSAAAPSYAAPEPVNSASEIQSSGTANSEVKPTETKAPVTEKAPETNSDPLKNEKENKSTKVEETTEPTKNDKENDSVKDEKEAEPKKISEESVSDKNEKENTSTDKTVITEKGKSEVVYAKLDLTGLVKDAFIVNRFGAKDGTFTDYGDYSSVQALSPQGSVSQSNTEMKVENNGKSFYYQGTLKNKNLPWIFHISYMLDGKEISPDKLSGVSGSFELKMHISRNALIGTDDITNSWANTAVLQVSITLPGEVAKRIETGGSIAQNGSNQTVTFMVLPGQAETDLSLSAKVENFYMPSIQIAGIPLNMDLSTIELPEFSGNEDLLKLQNGTKQLADGSKALSDGLSQLKQGNDEFDPALSRLSAGSKLLSEKTEELNTGLDEFFNGIGELQQGGSDLKNGVDDAYNGIIPLSEGFSQITDGWDSYVSTLDNKLSDLNSGVNDLDSGATQLLDGAKKIAEGLDSLTANNPSEASSEINAAIQEFADKVPSLTDEQLNSIKSMLENSSNGELGTASKAFNDAISTLSTSAADLSAGAKTLSDNANELSPVATRLYAGLGEIVKNLPAKIEIPEDEEGIEQYKANLKTEIVAFIVANSKPEQGLTSELLATEPLNPLIDAFVSMQFESAKNTSASLNPMIDGLNALYDEKDENGNAIAPAAILNENLPKLAEGAASVSSGAKAISDGLSDLSVKYSDFDKNIQNLNALLPALSKFSPLFESLSGIEELANNYDKFNNGLTDYVAGVNELKAAFTADSDSEEYYKTLLHGIELLQSGISEMSSELENSSNANSSVTELLDGQKRLSEGLSEFSDGLNILNSSITKFTGGVDTLAENGAAVKEGITSYTDGTSEFMNGITELGTGLTGFSDGLGRLSAGSLELADGSDELYKNTSNIDKSIQDAIDKYIQDFKTKKTPLKSFASDKNTVEQVQFILLTDEIKKKEEPVPEKIEVPEETILDRFWKLFQ